MAERFRLQRVASITPFTVLLTRVAAVLLALVVAGIAFAVIGLDPASLASDVIGSSFGNAFGLQDLGLVISPLILTGLATAVTLRIGLWNIGGEGQFYAGAIFATAVGLNVNGPLPLLLVLMFVAGFVGGVVWILIPAVARAWLAVDEIISTLLLNFVALLLVYYLCTGPWRDPHNNATSASARIPYDIPTLWGDLHWGLPVAVLVVVAVALLLGRTTWGYEVRLAGSNRHAAHYAGVPVRRRLVQVMLLSGGLAGIAGMLEATGTVHHLQGGMSNNYGYVGIMVAVLAGASPLAVLPAAVLMAVILNSGIVLESDGVTSYEVLALTGLVLFFVAMAEQLAYYRIARRPA
jgi:general nucleoside transport system permease protein